MTEVAGRAEGRSLLIVSNGHGEDAIGAGLAAAVRRRLPDVRLDALPLVGAGRSYEVSCDAVLGPRARLPADGLTLHHPTLLWRDLRAGLLRVTLAQARALRRARPDAVLVVGDVFAQAMSVRLADGAGRVPLHRTFMERIRAPERLLMRRLARRVYTRDEVTAAYLRRRGVPHAVFVGNPMMDALQGRDLLAGQDAPVLALLPGTRAYAERSVRRMLEVVARVGRVHALVASIQAPPAPPPGWCEEPGGPHGTAASWRRGDSRVWWLHGRFADVLASADAVLGTSGTAQEQAAGLGVPVVAFALPPEYGEAFLANQQRLLGAALRVVPDDLEALTVAVQEALADGPHRAAARRVGPQRMGPAGGCERIADDVVALLSARPVRPRPG
jgi:uncharacterized protein (TIGR03492 family)